MGDRAPPPPPGGPLGPPHLLHNPVGDNVPTLGALDTRLTEIDTIRRYPLSQRVHLAEVEGVGPDMDEAVEGDEDQEHDQDGHDHLVNYLINLCLIND